MSDGVLEPGYAKCGPCSIGVSWELVRHTESQVLPRALNQGAPPQHPWRSVRTAFEEHSLRDHRARS